MLKERFSRESAYVFISWILKIGIVIALLINIILQHWEGVILVGIVLILLLLPILIKRNYKFHLPIEVELIYIIFIYASIILGELSSYYTKLWWWDIALHTLSGVLLGLVGVAILYMLISENKLNAKPGIAMVFAFSFALAIGALWEIFEFAADQLFGFNMQKPMLGDFSGLTDTMWDLIVDAVGAFVASLFGYLYLKFKWENTFSKLMKKLIERNPKYFSK